MEKTDPHWREQMISMSFFIRGALLLPTAEREGKRVSPG
jgi:hypothetical protein